MKIALIPPVSLLEFTSKTDMQLMLPHLASIPQYRYTYLMHGKDPHQYLILDNGVAEGMRAGADMIMELGDFFLVNEIVLPDVLTNAEKTRLLSNNFLDLAKTHYRGRILSKPKFMYVLQGTSFNQVIKEAQWGAKQPMVDVFGLPRHLITTTMTGSHINFSIRSNLAAKIQEISDKPIHLLGGSPDAPNELGELEFTNNVRSHDTSSPFNYAYFNKQLQADIRCGRPLKYFDKPASSFDEHFVNINVNDLMRWAGYDI